MGEDDHEKKKTTKTIFKKYVFFQSWPTKDTQFGLLKNPCQSRQKFFHHCIYIYTVEPHCLELKCVKSSILSNFSYTDHYFYPDVSNWKCQILGGPKLSL